MPRLWSETIDAHRRAVRDATMDATAALIAEHGLASVTMSRIAEKTGIGRATLYKYFPDVEAILAAWHERQITHHLQQLTEVRDHAEDPLAAVAEAYALIQQQHQGTPAETLLHRGDHVGHAREQLHDLVRDILRDGVPVGRVRDDVPPDELAAFCLHALSAAAELPSKAAARRLVAVTLTALRPHG